MPLAPRAIAYTSRAVTGVEIHPAARIGEDFFIDHGSGVVIGETAEIGDRVTLYQGVTLGGTGFARGKRHPTVEDDVTVGSGAKLLGPVTVGRGAKVGANTVVIEDVPARHDRGRQPGPSRSGSRARRSRARTPTGSTCPTRSPRRSRSSPSGSRCSSGASAELDGEAAEGGRHRAARRSRDRARPAGSSGAAPILGSWPPERGTEGRTRGGARAAIGRADRGGRGPGRAPARGAQPAAARGRHPRRGPAAGPRRRRLGQDPGAHPPDRLAARDRPGAPERDPRDHLHQQGRRARCASGSRAWSAASRARMWVMTFHAACARHPARSRPSGSATPARFTIYDEADSLRMVKRCLEELGVDPKRYPPRAVRARISDAKNQLVDAETYQETAGGPSSRRRSADAYRLYERRMLEANAMDFDDLLMRTVNLLELFEDVRRPLPRALPLGPRRRVPGHQPRPVPAAAAARRGARQPDRRRRRRSSRSTASAAPTSATSSSSSSDFPDADGRQARAELPLHRRRSSTPPTRSSRTTREPAASTSGPIGRGRADRRRRARRRARGGPLRRRRDRAAGRARRGLRATRSRSSTGPTRRAGCSRTPWSASSSPTR